MENITRQILARYFEALGAETYLLRLVHTQGAAPAMGGVRTVAEILKQTEWLKLKNLEGYQIYCRPIGWQYVLIDDLPPETLPRANELSPCIVMETSPNNFQAWLRLATVPNTREEALSVCRELAELLGADKGSAEPDHVGRLPSFTNRKEKYRTAKGFPFVRLLVSKKNISSFSPKGGRVLKEETPVHTPPLSNGAALSAPVQSPKKSNDRSAADFNLACMLIRQGKSDEHIREQLEHKSEKAQGRRGDYIGRTIANARKAVTRC